MGQPRLAHSAVVVGVGEPEFPGPIGFRVQSLHRVGNVECVAWIQPGCRAADPGGNAEGARGSELHSPTQVPDNNIGRGERTLDPRLQLVADAHVLEMAGSAPRRVSEAYADSNSAIC